MFEVWKDKVNKQYSYSYGLTSMNGIVYPTIYFFKNTLGIDKYPVDWYNSIFLLINDTDKTWVSIADENTKANAYVSIFCFFYRDGGLLGIIIGMCIYAIFLSYKYVEFLYNDNIKNLCKYMILLQEIIFSYVRFQFASEGYFLAYLFIVLFAYRKNVIE